LPVDVNGPVQLSNSTLNWKLENWKLFCPTCPHLPDPPD
jgi:hypothetical protein